MLLLLLGVSRVVVWSATPILVLYYFCMYLCDDDICTDADIDEVTSDYVFTDDDIQFVADSLGMDFDEVDSGACLALIIVTGKHNQKDRKSTRLNSSHITRSRMPSSA